MINQFPIIYIDQLILDGVDKEDILQSIFLHSHNEEEREELIDYDFIMDSDLSYINNEKLYSIEINNDTNH